jgi:hypothetical protein
MIITIKSKECNDLNFVIMKLSYAFAIFRTEQTYVKVTVMTLNLLNFNYNIEPTTL